MRSPGVYFTLDEDPTTGRKLCYAKLIPNRGAWLEFETSNRDVLSVKVDRKRKIPVTTLLRADRLRRGDGRRDRIERCSPTSTPTRTTATSRRRSTRTPTKTHATRRCSSSTAACAPATRRRWRTRAACCNSLFFNPRRYDLAQVGRYKLNQRLGAATTPRDARAILTQDDLVEIVRDDDPAQQRRRATPDDIDHLGNRRVRAVGELIQNQFRIGLLRMERVVKERMTIQDPEHGDAERADQHPPGRGRDEGVLRRLASSRSSWTRPTRWPS